MNTHKATHTQHMWKDISLVTTCLLICSVWTLESLTCAFGVGFLKQMYLAVLGSSILWDFPHNFFTA